MCFASDDTEDAVRVAKRVNSKKKGGVSTAPEAEDHPPDIRSRRGGGGVKADVPSPRRNGRRRDIRSSGPPSSAAEQPDQNNENCEGGRYRGEGSINGSEDEGDVNGNADDGGNGNDDGVADDVVAAGAALSALSAAPHPQTPLVSHLPSQRMASPKRVQDNVFLTTVTSPARSVGVGTFSRPSPPGSASSARASEKSAGGNSGAPGVRREVTGLTRGMRGGIPGGGGIGGGVYAFGESPSKVREKPSIFNRGTRMKLSSNKDRTEAIRS